MSAPVVARSTIRKAITDLLAADGWESWTAVAELVAEYTRAPITAVDETLDVMWRAGAIDIRGRSNRRQVKLRPPRPRIVAAVARIEPRRKPTSWKPIRRQRREAQSWKEKRDSR